MRKIGMMLVLFLAACGLRAQVLPVFSTGDTEAWYYIRFKNGNAVLQDMGEGASLQTAEVAKNNNAQLWKLTGRQSACEIVGKSGRHIYYNGSRYAAAAASTGNLKLVATPNASYSPAWEIQTASVAGQSMNQWGGAGTGRELGSWSAGDVNNPLEFVPVDDMEFPDVEPAPLTEYRLFPVRNYVPENRLTLWYTTPVTAETVGDPWMEYALPIGNGQLGAMVYGGIRQERVQFNEKTLWTGSPTKRGAYQNFGCLYMEDTEGSFSVTSVRNAAFGYCRQLDLATATATTRFMKRDSSNAYVREYIASHPDRCIVIRLSASAPGGIFQKFYLYNAVGTTPSYTAEGYATFAGKLDLLSYAACMRVVPTGGTMTADATGIQVDGADEVLVVLSGITNYDPQLLGYAGDASTLKTDVRTLVDRAAEKGWSRLYADHLADYKTYFDRVDLHLQGAVNTVDTKSLVDAYNASANAVAGDASLLMLEELYFHYGRYLLIASSRGVDLPANLQGIWNHKNAPPWESDIHSNINVQMNYWPAEPTNLSELHLPFLNYVYNMAEIHSEWPRYARNSGQSVGWTCYTQNNIFGHSDFMENYVIANAWYCSHAWQHYRYTLDKDYLRRTAFPVMLSCTRYWLERLKKDSRVNDGTWVCPNEWSPEHGPNEDAVAHAQQLVWDLFRNTLVALDTLGADSGTDAAFRSELEEKFRNLDTGLHTETYNGTWGASRNGVSSGDPVLREWKYTDLATGNGGESGHRHLSHLMCLFPCSQVAPGSPYFVPAVNALKLRGDESTGWSMGWKINLWARALDGDHAHTILKAALKHAGSYGTDQSKGGIYYNLFDAHAPFQIDGNFGACSGIAEMLLQSHTDTLLLLPALPALWKEGRVAGLRAVGNFTVDLSWNEQLLCTAKIVSHAGQTCRISYPGIAKARVTVSDGTELTPQVLDANTLVFPTKAGLAYTLTTGHPDLVEPLTSHRSSLSFSGRTVRVASATPFVASVVDMSGKTVLRTRKAVFDVPRSAGHLFVIRIDGAAPEAWKVRLAP